MNLKKIGKVVMSKFVGTGPSFYKNRIYRAAFSQRLRNTVLEDHNMHVYRRERYCVGHECTNVGHMFVQATKFCTVAPSIVRVCYSPFFYRAHKNVYQLRLPSGKCHKIVRATCHYKTGGPQHGNS